MYDHPSINIQTSHGNLLTISVRKPLPNSTAKIDCP
jgi:hypothetical protein